jgi:hypothetical protein
MVFCRKPAENLTRREIAEAIEEATFFDDDPVFDPPLDSAEASDPEWDSFEIRYAAAKRPVVIFRRGALKGIEEDIEEEFVKPPLDPTLKSRLVEAKQVFSLDVSQDSLTEEAWEMCDFIEHFIANRCDGLVWAPGDGIFDAKLQPIAKATAR